MSNGILPPEVTGFIAKAKARLAKLKSLDKPIRDLPGASWQKQLDRSAETDSALSDLGTVKLSGEITAGAHITKIGRPPLEAEDFAGDPDESATAWASLVLAGNGGPSFETSQPFTGGSLSAGVSAGAAVELAQHRSFSQAKSAVGALVDVLDGFTVAYDLSRVGKITERDVLVAEISGSVVLRADAAWTYGLVRELEGETIEKLEIKEPVAIQAGATIGLTVQASIEGKLRIVVESSPNAMPGRNLVRVELFKHRGSFVGAGLDLSAGLSIENVEPFIDSVLAQLLRVPDDLVAELTEIRQQLESLRVRLESLEPQAKADLGRAAGKAGEAVGLDDLQELAARLESQTPAVQVILGRFKGAIDRVLQRVRDAQDDLEEFVDDVFAQADQSLETVDAVLARWIDGYNQLRKKSADFIKNRALEGIQLELAAGINRSHANDALLDLEFDLDMASDLYLEAVRGNFSPALQAARAHGANGVELLGGTLKETTRKERFSNLKLNLFGFNVKRDLKSWSQVEVSEDLQDGSLYLTGKTGASFNSELGKTARALSFIFDLTSAAEHRDGKIFLTDPTAGYRATLARTASIAKNRQIMRTLPLHVNGAVTLGMLDTDSAASLLERLRAANGDYSYDLKISFPPEAVERVFLFERADAKPKQLRPLVWETFRRAVRSLDMVLPARPEDCPLSALMTQGAIEQVRRQPFAEAIRRFRAPSVLGITLASGAERLLWVHIFEAHLFIEAYLDARETLISGEPVAKINRGLRQLARRTRKAIGSVGTRPLDAKYLTLALLAGTALADVNLTFKRGDVAVTL
jgi:HPt (histidine-containing phosphotransfer) domain-containing protein